MAFAHFGHSHPDRNSAGVAARTDAAKPSVVVVAGMR